jgi:cytochrome c oxidase accessory protein FixG
MACPSDGHDGGKLRMVSAHKVRAAQSTPLPSAEYAAAGPISEQVELYEVSRTIYPRAVHGWFARWRVAIVVATQLAFYGGAWVDWNGRQAVLFDLAARKFYIFGLVLWPQDFFFLAVLLIICAMSLFLFTAVAGRLWCGYACPQTVYTEIFLWIERSIEGDRLQRMKLDGRALDIEKLFKKTFKHGVWFSIAMWTGFTFVGYFTPIRELTMLFLQTRLGSWETFWIFFYALATYGNAGWMREQVCKYMCPYARFQSVMFDADTLTITYDANRGEARGARARGADLKKLGLGDCVDCGICVQVCPAGIDIRNGLQYECIGCAACIDGCNQVMDKLGYARGLIRYSTENAMRGYCSGDSVARRILRPRTLVYSSVLLALIAGMAAGLLMRVPLKVDVIRDRGVLMRETSSGELENVYRLQIMNTAEHPRTVIITASGMHGLQLLSPATVLVPAAGALVQPVSLRVKAGSAPPGSYKVSFHIEDADDGKVVANEKSMFYVR